MQNAGQTTIGPANAGGQVDATFASNNLTQFENQPEYVRRETGNPLAGRTVQQNINAPGST